MNSIATFQIGKSGVSPAVVSALNTMLIHHKHIRIATLKSSGRNRDSIHKMAEDLVSKLNVPCEYRVIGFTIALRRALQKSKKAL